MPKNIDPSVEGLAGDYPAGTLIEAHMHDAHQIVHAVSGTMRVWAAGGIWIVPPGRGLWVPARVEHEIRCVGLVKMRTVYFQDVDASWHEPVLPRAVKVIGISALMREILIRLTDGPCLSQVSHLSPLLMDEIAAGKTEPLCLPLPDDLRIARLTSHFLEEPADTTSLVEWASRLGMSQRSLIRRIFQEIGMTFRELRRQARIMASMEKLASGEPVTRVALDVGFESPSAFIQAFKKVIGTTPRRYMQGSATPSG